VAPRVSRTPKSRRRRSLVSCILMIDISLQLQRNAASTARLLDSVSALDDGAVGRPSELPGWNRAQVITHLARNADGFTGMYAAARQGVVAHQYPHGRAGRAADIDAGRDGSAVAVTADLRASIDRLQAEAVRLTPEEWQRDGEVFAGRIAIWETLSARRREVEVHHVDLRVGYKPADWRADFVSTELAGQTRGLSARIEDTSSLTLVTLEGEKWEAVGPGGPDGPVTVVAGPGAQILAWLLGRPTSLEHPPAIGSWQ
jgi:maleylpyruvate isomerase